MKKIKIKNKENIEIGTLLMLTENSHITGILILIPYVSDVRTFAYTLNEDDTSIIADIFKKSNLDISQYNLLTL